MKHAEECQKKQEATEKKLEDIRQQVDKEMDKARQLEIQSEAKLIKVKGDLKAKKAKAKQLEKKAAKHEAQAAAQAEED